MTDLATRCQDASRRAARWLAEQVRPDGDLEEADLAAYYKAPLFLQMSGYAVQAHAVLGAIARKFGRRDGDFATSPETPGDKTADPALKQYPGYMNGWIVQGAQCVGRYDLSFRGYAFLRHFAHSDGAGGLDGPPGTGDDTVELLMTCHIGAVALAMGDISTARAAGDALLMFWRAQPDPERLHLRLDAQRHPIAQGSEEGAVFRVIEAGAQGQLWFFAGYAIAFPTLLYRATGEAHYLDLAKDYAGFCLNCPALPREHFAHKVAWGAALLADATEDLKYQDFAAEIAEMLVRAQAPAGDWLPDQPRATRLDQTAELGLRLGEIGACLR